MPVRRQLRILRNNDLRIYIEIVRVIEFGNGGIGIAWFYGDAGDVSDLKAFFLAVESGRKENDEN